MPRSIFLYRAEADIAFTILEAEPTVDRVGITTDGKLGLIALRIDPPNASLLKLIIAQV
jgi:hypothetical protein